MEKERREELKVFGTQLQRNGRWLGLSRVFLERGDQRSMCTENERTRETATLAAERVGETQPGELHPCTHKIPLHKKSRSLIAELFPG